MKTIIILILFAFSAGTHACDRNPTKWYLENIAKDVHKYAQQSDAIVLAVIKSKKSEGVFARKNRQWELIETERIVRAKVIGGWGKKLKSTIKITENEMNSATHCFGNGIHAYVEENDFFYFFYNEGYITFSIRADIANSLGYIKLGKMDYRKI